MLTILFLALQSLRQSFEYESRTSDRPRLLLSAAVAGGTDKVNAGYDVPVIAR